MDEVIHRQLRLLSRHAVMPIEIVSGSQVPIRLEIMDYTIPAGAIAKVYATIQGGGPVYVASGTVFKNTVTFTPPDGFFTPGRNRMQLELNDKIIPLSLEVICQSRVSQYGETSTPEAVTPLALRAETAAANAEESALAARNANAAAQSAKAAAESAKNAAQTSATAASNSGTNAENAKTAAAESATAAGNAQTAAQDAKVAAESAAANAENAMTAAQTAKAAAESARNAAQASASAASESATYAGNAKTAAETAAHRAEESVTAAQNILTQNQAVAVMTPYVGERGNWMVWNQTTGEYVDSGIKAQGDTGPKGDVGDTGATGAAGTNAYVHIRYAAQQPNASAPTTSTTPDAWIGIYSGPESTAPTDWQAYTWYNIKGTKGATGPQGEQGPEGATGPQGEQGPKGEKGDTGAAAVLTSSSVVYQVSESGTTVPSGDWSNNIPSADPGQYLWTRITTVYNTGEPVVAYSVARMGIDGNGSVSSVAGISPDESGNVALSATNVGAVATVEGLSPDESGNVSILNIVYPVGAIYLSTVATSPAAIFGGTWERIQNRFLLAAGNDYAAGSQGGEAAHTLTVNEMPSHTHGMGKRLLSWDSSDPNKLAVARDTASPLSIYTDYSQFSKTLSEGGGSAHNNMPPYLAVYVWKRTA